MTFFQEVYDRIRCATNARTQTELAAVLEIRQSSISDAKRRNSIPSDWYMKLFEKADKFIMCCGQGAWEADLLASTRGLQAILESKGIHPIVDIWGQDVSHDWYWWEKQWVYFLQMTLGGA